MPVRWRALQSCVSARSCEVVTCRKCRASNHLVLVLALVKSMLVRPVGLLSRPRTGNADGQVVSGRGVPLRNCVGKRAERGLGESCQVT